MHGTHDEHCSCGCGGHDHGHEHHHHDHECGCGHDHHDHECAGIIAFLLPALLQSRPVGNPCDGPGNAEAL